MPNQHAPILPTILIAGQSSGVGKTTITLGLIAALRRRGLVVQPFKCGPDYIDPTYHTLAAGRPCRNLDTWMLTPEQMRAGFERACSGADMAIVEGVMGLFDGASYEDESGSAAQMARLLGAPVLLVLDISKLARSAGALALGYQQFDPETPLAGFILNRAGSESHARGCASAITATTGLPVVGWLSKDDALHIPERHLGLVPTGEREPLDRLIERAADVVESGFDVEKLGIGDWGSETGNWDLAEPLKSLSRPIARRQQSSQETKPDAQPDPESPVPNPQSPILAVARDEAFSFYYPDNLELLAAAGARICFFSPLQDKTLPQGTAGVYLGGGFPEIYARRLSENQGLWAALRRLHARGAPIYAECGGFMVLTEAVIDLDGRRWPMAGLVPGETRMQTRLAGLGYRIATATGAPNLLLSRGEDVRGHEFHYSTWTVDPSLLTDHSAWTLRRRPDDAESRPDGYVDGNLLASYLHIHFGQRTELAVRFVEKMGIGD